MSMMEWPLLSVVAALTLLGSLASGAVIGHFCKVGESAKQAFSRGFLAMMALCVILLGVSVLVL